MDETQNNEILEVSFVDRLLSAAFTPNSSDDLGIFYMVWIFLFLLIHLTWDMATGKTPIFHLRRLETKTTVLFSAATFASSLIVLFSILSPSVRNLLSNNSLPLILAGFSGLLQSIPYMCPYDLSEALRGNVPTKGSGENTKS